MKKTTAVRFTEEYDQCDDDDRTKTRQTTNACRTLIQRHQTQNI